MTRIYFNIICTGVLIIIFINKITSAFPVIASSFKYENNRSQTDTDFLNNVLRHPRIRFYEQGNGSTSNTFVDYDLVKEKTSQKGCLDLELEDQWLPLYLKDIAVDTFGTCVRLFEGPSCTGWSLAVYPGSSGSKKEFMPKYQKVMNSLGHCLQNEFTKARVVKNYDGTRKILKDTSPAVFVPDELRVGGYEKIVSFSVVTTWKDFPKMKKQDQKSSTGNSSRSSVIRKTGK